MTLLNNIDGVKLGIINTDRLYLGNNLVWSKTWSPLDIGSSLVLWLDADDTATITLNGSSVSQWNDKSTNNNHVTQEVATNQPTYQIAAINGKNALDCTDDLMATSTNPFGNTINDAFVAVVYRVDAVTAGTLFSLTGFNDVLSRWQSHAPWSTGDVMFDCGGSTVGTTRIRTNYGVVAGSILLAGFYCSVADNVQQVWKNGSLLAADNSGHSVAANGNVSIGGIMGATPSYQNATIGEVVAINGTISEQNRQKLEGYLAHKWGLTESLSSSHPYKDSAP